MTENRQPMPVSERLLISEKVAAEMLSVSRTTFRKWVAAGLIPITPGPAGDRRNLYKREDLEAFVKSL